METRDGANHIEGNLSAAGRSFGVVASRFNDFVVRRLLDGALDAIRRHGGDLGSVDVVWVPGSYEIPLAAKRLALSGRYVANGAASGISSVALEANLPVIFGVITTETIEQAIDRAGTKLRNKGVSAAVTAIELADLMPRI